MHVTAYYRRHGVIVIATVHGWVLISSGFAYFVAVILQPLSSDIKCHFSCTITWIIIHSSRHATECLQQHYITVSI